MSVNWSYVRLKDYCTKIGSGSTPKGGANVYLDSGNTCLIRSQNIYNDGFSENGLVFISDSDAEKLNNVAIELDDILINITGDSVARVCLAPEGKLPARVNQHVAIIRTVKNELDPKFVRYFLTDKNTQNHLLTLAGIGATRNALTKGMLEEFLVPKPDIVIQERISKILSDLDDKIHLNNQINQTLESIAQAIFKSWFIDFEPVRAKIAAKQAGQDPERAAMCAISGKSEAELEQMAEDDFAELRATAALFPDELVESELGEVPRGWEVTLLKDVVTELRRGISPKYTEDLNSVIVINQKCIRNHTINFFLARKHDNLKRKIDGRELQIGDVLVNSTGVGTLGRIAPVRYLDSITVVDSHVTVVRANDKKISRAYLQGLLLENEKFIEASGAGTTGQTELRKEVVQDIKFPNPTVALHQQFDSIICKINQKIANLEKMNICLSHVRDTLLPKLLSGEVDVSDLHGEVA